MSRACSRLLSALAWLVPVDAGGPQAEPGKAALELPGPWSLGLALAMHSEGGPDPAANRSEVGELVSQFKYGGQRHLVRRLAAAMARMLAPRLGERRIDVATHVPTSRRGSYEPARELAIGVARALHVRPLPRLLRSIRTVQPQKDLTTLWEKRRNVDGAFVVRRPELVRGRTVLLVDDIYDSGATLAEGWRASSDAGCGEIIVAAATRTRYLGAGL